MKTKANSIANLCYNLFGYLPAPFLYGIFRDSFADEKNRSKSRAGMVMLMWMTVACAGFLFIAMLFRKIKTKENEEETPKYDD